MNCSERTAGDVADLYVGIEVVVNAIWMFTNVVPNAGGVTAVGFYV